MERDNNIRLTSLGSGQKTGIGAFHKVFHSQ